MVKDLSEGRSVITVLAGDRPRGTYEIAEYLRKKKLDSFSEPVVLGGSGMRDFVNNFFEDDAAYSFISKLATMFMLTSFCSALLTGLVLYLAGQSPVYLGLFDSVVMFTVVGGIFVFCVLFGIVVIPWALVCLVKKVLR